VRSHFYVNQEIQYKLKWELSVNLWENKTKSQKRNFSGKWRMNMVQTFLCIMYTHKYKYKDDTCWKCSRSQGRGELKYDIFDTF
jgi:hypothetical protein